MSMHHRIGPNKMEVVDDDLANVLREKSPAERIQMVGDADDTARVIPAAGIRYCYPFWLEDQVQQEVAQEDGWCIRLSYVEIHIGRLQ
jgi:hypothetical protein